MSQVVEQRFLDATTHTVAWFWKRLAQGELVAQPPYQRNPVWQLPQKQFLIDSILNGYPVPEIYLQTSTDAEGAELHTIVDGQQRIRACMEFVDGKFPLADDATAHQGAYFKELPEAARKSVFGYKFVVRMLPELPEAEIRDIFARLNRNNIALNAQELRHATYWGSFIKSMEKLSELPFWRRAQIFTPNDIRRMLDIEYVSQLTVSNLFGLQDKRRRLDDTYARFEDEFDGREEFEQRFSKTLDVLSDHLDWPSKSRWSSKVDFFSLFNVVMEAMARDESECVRSVSERTEALERLAAEVDRLVRVNLSDRAELEAFSEEAVLYARGVRNSSDLGSRKQRHAALASVLFGIALPEGGAAFAETDVSDALAYDDPDDGEFS